MKNREEQLARLEKEGLLNASSVAALRQRLKEKLSEEREHQEKKLVSLREELSRIRLQLNF